MHYFKLFFFYINSDDNEKQFIYSYIIPTFILQGCITIKWLLMADYLVSEGGSTAQFLATILEVRILFPEILDTCEEYGKLPWLDKPTPGSDNS